MCVQSLQCSRDIYQCIILIIILFIVGIDSAITAQATFRNYLGNALGATETAYGQQVGYVSIYANMVWYDLDFTNIDWTQFESSCIEGGLSFHIHDKWIYGDSALSIGSGSADRFGIECHENFTGGHFDPWFACGPTSGNSECSNNGGCIPPSSVFEKYSCDYNFDLIPYMCEVGDLSGKYGWIDATDWDNITDVGSHTWDLYGSYWEVRETVLAPGLDPALPAQYSLVIHCGDADGEPLFCAPIVRHNNNAIPYIDLTDNEMITVDFTEAGSEFTNFAITFTNEGISFYIPSSAGPVCNEWYLLLYEDYPYYKSAFHNCDIATFGGIYDPTHSCIQNSASPYCADGVRCPGLMNISVTYDCNEEFDYMGCAVGDISSRIGSIIPVFSGDNEFWAFTYPFTANAPPLFSLNERGVVLTCLDDNNAALNETENICWGTSSSPITAEPTTDPTHPTFDPTNRPSLAPTSSPTMSPTHPTFDPTNRPSMAPTITCQFDGNNIEYNMTVIDECDFGYYGIGDIGRCLSNGEIGEWVKGCFVTSFSDNFFNFEDSIWNVWSAQGVSGISALSLDENDDSLRFIPDNSSLVGVIRSKQRIIWPMRVRGIVEKRVSAQECNLWSIGLGPTWYTRSSMSTRVNWACLGDESGDDYNIKQMSLYNATFRLYDSKCWNEQKDDVMEVIFSIRDTNITHNTIITTSSSDCASLRLQTTDILSQRPWHDAYLWIGSYGAKEADLENKINNSIVGRFDSIQYTQFFSDFDGLMMNIWNNNKSNIKEFGGKLYMAPNDEITSNEDLFQFTIPFIIKLGIEKPVVPHLPDGHFAHYVVLGAIKYSQEKRNNVIQMVWDGNKGVRLIYAANNIYVTGLNKTTADGQDYCNWNNTAGQTYDVTIYIDADKVTIIDDLCNGHNMTATHNLTTTQRSELSLGFIRPNQYSSSDRIAFTYIEAYQLPQSADYLGNIADINGDSETIVDIKDIYPDTEIGANIDDSSTATMRRFRLILDGDFDHLIKYLGKNKINLNDWSIEIIEYLMDLKNNNYFSLILIRIIDIYSGSIIIEYSLSVTDNDIDLINLAVNTIDRNNNVYYNNISYPIISHDEMIIISINNTIFLNETEEMDYYDQVSTDGVVGIFVFLILICCICSICGVLLCILNIILSCFGGKKIKKCQIARIIHTIFWILCIPITCIIYLISQIFVCNGCNRHVGVHFFHFIMNSLSTIILLAHFSFGSESYQEAVSNGVSEIIFNGTISGDVIYGFTIIGFSTINFVIKLFKFYKANQKFHSEKVKKNENISTHIKDLEIVIIGSSDTIFQILSAFAVIIGSKYAGIASSDDFNKKIAKQIVDYIFIAAIFAPIKEITHVLNEFLTMSCIFNTTSNEEMAEIKTVRDTFGDIFNFKFDEEEIKDGLFDKMFDKFNDEKFIPKTIAKYSAQKTVLWNAMWSGFKLLLLAIQQLFALIAALLLLENGSDIGWFLLIVIFCNLSMILIAFIMCTKYEKLSIGLCCKYYFCCFYNLCPIHCENKWIKLDPVKNKYKFNHLGFYNDDDHDKNDDNDIDGYIVTVKSEIPIIMTNRNNYSIIPITPIIITNDNNDKNDSQQKEGKEMEMIQMVSHQILNTTSNDNDAAMD